MADGKLLAREREAERFLQVSVYSGYQSAKYSYSFRLSGNCPLVTAFRTQNSVLPNCIHNTMHIPWRHFGRRRAQPDLPVTEKRLRKSLKPSIRRFITSAVCSELVGTLVNSLSSQTLIYPPAFNIGQQLHRIDLILTKCTGHLRFSKQCILFSRARHLQGTVKFSMLCFTSGTRCAIWVGSRRAVVKSPGNFPENKRL